MPSRSGTPSRKPNRSHGKVFFTLGGIDYVCSGTAVDSPAESARLDRRALRLRLDRPAQHRLRHQLGVRARLPERATHRSASGRATRPRARRRSGRHSSEGCLPHGRLCGDVAHDFGAANVAKLGGKTLQDRVGGRGISFNGPRDRSLQGVRLPGRRHRSTASGCSCCKSAYQGADHSSGQPAADADQLRHDRRLERRRLDRRTATSPRSSPTATRASRTTSTGPTRATSARTSTTRSRTGRAQAGAGLGRLRLALAPPPPRRPRAARRSRARCRRRAGRRRRSRRSRRAGRS